MIAPLDWGLGHATRCIPIINQLIALDCEVLIASSGGQKSLLEREFPGIRSLELPGYGIKYARGRWSTFLKLFIQIPKILTAIKRENHWLRTFLARERLDLVISDNRYGLHAEGVFSVFVTHQLCIQTPFGKGRFGRAAEQRLQKMQYRYIDFFSRCWVPDLETGGTLAGRLSHPELFPHTDVRYIGILSRFSDNAGIRSSEGGVLSGENNEVLFREGEIPSSGGGALSRGAEGGFREEQDIDILFLLSGPEPQRSLLERQVVRELRWFDGRAVIVRGLPGGRQGISTKREEWEWAIERDKGRANDIAAGSFEMADVSVYSHLPAAALKKIMDRTSLVVSRAGYSTIMDLAALGKRAVLIPTPGQSEQEYLGQYLAGRKMFLCVKQDGFSLPAMLEAARRFPFRADEYSGRPGAGRRETDLLDREIREILAQIRGGSAFG